MPSIKLTVGAAIVVVAATIALVVWRQQQAKGFAAEAATLREQATESAALREENRHLSDLLKAATEASEANSRELLRLRAQTGAIRQLEQENARLKSERDRLAKQAPQAPPEEDGPYDRLFGQGGNARIHHAMRWGTALINYASQHQGQFPASFQEAVPFMHEDLSAEEKAQTASTADQYETLYHGRREDMTNPPPEGAILIREKQPWRTTQGAWARTYIYGNGAGTIHTEPDGNFERWEGPRIPKSSSP